MRQRIKAFVAVVRRVKAAPVAYSAGVVSMSVGASLAWFPAGFLVAGSGLLFAGLQLIDMGDD